MTSWPTRIATVNFVAHPDQLVRAQRMFLERLNRIPAEQARIHFVSAHPVAEENEFDLWSLRCTAVYESQRLPLPDPETLELLSVHCVLSVNPNFEDKVSESLFFCDHAEPDPFPGTQYRTELVPFVADQEWREQHFRHERSGTQTGVATRWLVTLHLAASGHEARKLTAEYSRLTRVLGETPDLALQSFSPAPTEVEDYAILGPLWLADTRRAVADPSSATEYPPARLLHRARLVLGCDGDPTPLLPETRLAGTWTTEPLV